MIRPQVNSGSRTTVPLEVLTIPKRAHVRQEESTPDVCGCGGMFANPEQETEARYCITRLVNYLRLTWVRYARCIHAESRSGVRASYTHLLSSFVTVFRTFVVSLSSSSRVVFAEAVDLEGSSTNDAFKNIII